MVIMNKNNKMKLILMKPHPTQDLKKVLIILRKEIQINYQRFFYHLDKILPDYALSEKTLKVSKIIKLHKTHI